MRLALCGDAGLDVDLRRVQLHAGAGGEPQRLFDGDPFLGGHGQLTRIDRVQPGGVQAYLAVGGRTAADGYLAGQRGQGPVHLAAVGVVARQVAADDQAAAARHGRLRLQIAVHVPLRRIGLARPLVDLAGDAAFQPGLPGRDDQAPASASLTV
ncbi:hypothetical protein WJ968_34260 [Achromobacter xylosoxidans]